MNPLLDAIQPDKIEVEWWALGFAQAFRSFLEKQDRVLKIREGYRRGDLTVDQVREFVETILQIHFKKGFQFWGERTLSALVVALEPIRDNFTDEFINDLAALNIAEITLANRVARLCKEKRESDERTERKPGVHGHQESDQS